MQLSKMQNEIYWSLVMIQYHAKGTNPLYPKFKNNKLCLYIFGWNLYLVIAYILILTTNKFSHPFISQSYVSLYFFPFNLICNMTTFRCFFYLLTRPYRLSVCVRTEYVLAWCSRLYSLQHDYFQGKTMF